MNQFYLNNAVGVPKSVEEGSKALRNAVMAFNSLYLKEELRVSKEVVLDKDPKLIQFGEIYLEQLIHAIQDRDERRIALILLKGVSPMELYFKVDADKDINILYGDYRLNGRDASNLALVHKHHGMLLTFAFEDSYRKNSLELTAASPGATDYFATIQIDNLYESGENIGYIEQVLAKRNGIGPDLINEIEGYGFVHNTVKRVFKKLTDKLQLSVVEAFRNAINQHLLTPHAGAGNNAISPNNELVRYESHTKNENLFELAIYHPKALRVFIAQDKGDIFILDIKSKEELQDGGPTQNRALRVAEKRFKNMKKAYRGREVTLRD